MLRFALFTCAMALASPAAAFPRVYFFCMTDAHSPPVIRVGPMSPNQTEARFLYPPDHEGVQRGPDMLWIGENDAGEIRYHTGDLSLNLAAEDTTLQVDDAIIPCTQLELPQDHPRGTFPALARSTGGVMRAGPVEDQPELGRIAPDETLFLVSRTEGLTAGFPWFELYSTDGTQGYVWGGNLCPGFEPLEGVQPSCTP